MLIPVKINNSIDIQDVEITNEILRGKCNNAESNVRYSIKSNERNSIRILHPNKPFKWIYKKYFKADYTGVSKDKWILTDPHNNKTQLFKMSWIPIVRHVVVKYSNSPDDASMKKMFGRLLLTNL